MTLVQDPTLSADAALEKLAVYKRAYDREKDRRQYVEKMLEDKSRDLYLSSQELNSKNEALSNANTLLESQYNELTGLSNDYERVKQDLSYAAKIQSSLLPSPLELPGISITGDFMPAEFLAGDGYDYFALNEDIFAFYIIDVVGHGIAAAMISFAVQIQLNPKSEGICQKHLASAKNLGEAAEATLNELNEMFYYDETASRYFTMIYGLVNLKSGEVCIGQAGHPPPMLWQSSSGAVSPQGKGGTPVAMLDEPLFGIYKFQMHEGDRLYVYSDGITECRNKEDEEFGDENLMQLIGESSSLPLQPSADALTAAVTTWNDGEDFDDDLSLLVLEYRKI